MINFTRNINPSLSNSDAESDKFVKNMYFGNFIQFNELRLIKYTYFRSMIDIM